MLILRLTQSLEGPDRHRIEIALEGDGRARQTAVSAFSFALTPQDREDVRWYLEDFLDYPFDPNPAIAARIERRMVWSFSTPSFNRTLTHGTCGLWCVAI